MIETLNNFFISDTASCIYWVTAIGGTAFFVIFTLMTFFFSSGADIDLSTDVDIDGGIHADSGIFAFKVFSLNSILSFLMFFGWGGLMFGKSFYGFLAALGLGLIVMLLIGFLLNLILKLQDGGEKIISYIGLKGTVYLTIEAGRLNNGVVHVSTRDGFREIKAVADTQIPTGSLVSIVEKIDGSLYLVEKL